MGEVENVADPKWSSDGDVSVATVAYEPQTKSKQNIISLYSRHYDEASGGIHLRGFAPRQHRNVAAVASLWRNGIPFDRPGNRTPDFLRRYR